MVTEHFIKLYNACIGLIHLHLNVTCYNYNCRTDCSLVVMLGILALSVSLRSSEDKRSTKEF